VQPSQGARKLGKVLTLVVTQWPDSFGAKRLFDSAVGRSFQVRVGEAAGDEEHA